MCLSVCLSVIVKIKKTSMVQKNVCGARRLENKNYSGFQNNSEFPGGNNPVQKEKT